MDYSATTGVHPDVLAAMMPYLGPEFGNPNSIHSMGVAARQAVEDARARVARVLGCRPSEIVFTGCATESINLAIKGIVRAQGRTGHVITSAIEHHAVLHSVEQLEREGYEATVVPVSSEGIVDPDDVRRALRPDTRLISIMYANNQIGTIQPIAEIGRIGREAGVPVHTDAVQAARSESLDAEELHVSSLALSGHKFHAPKGVGILYLRESTPLEPQQVGGGQEGGRRSGTENVPYIVGIATALERAAGMREEYRRHTSRLRDEIFEGLLRELPDVRINGSRERRLPNNVHVSFRGIEAQALLMGLDMRGICAASDSACQQAALQASHVLQAIGVPEDYLYGSLRLTLGDDSTEEDVQYLLDCLPELVRRLQALSPAAV